MPKFSAKKKIIIITVAWFLVSVAMLTYFFKFFYFSNSEALDSIVKQKKELAKLQAELKSESQAQRDLQELAQKKHQPEDFFSRDVTLVSELETLESLGARFGVEIKPTGISGTVKNALPAKTTTPLAIIPYNITITGSLVNVVDTIETLENLDFITNLSNVSINASNNGQVIAGLTANFFLKKQ